MNAVRTAPRTSSDAEELDDEPFADCGGSRQRIVTPEAADVARI